MVESKRFITDAVNAGKPFFVWHNTTRMHYRFQRNMMAQLDTDFMPTV
jgi:hypothetical protein